MLVDLDIADKQYASAMDRVQKQIDQNPKAAQPLAMRAKFTCTRDFTHAEADLLKSDRIGSKLEPTTVAFAGLRGVEQTGPGDRKAQRFLKNNNNDVPALMRLGLYSKV